MSRQVGRLNAAPENAQFDWTEAGLAPGEVLIRIRSEEASGVPYVLRFRVLDVPVPAVPEVEPNSPDLALRPTTLQALQPGVPILGTHWSADDLDRFQVTVPQSGVLSLTLERDGAVGRTRLRLLSEMLQLLGELTTAPERPTDTLRAVATPGVYYVELVPEGEVSPREGYRLSAALEVPGVLEASHDATRPLRRGERLTVRATAPPGMRAELLLGPDGRTVPLYDDGTHGDPTAGDGSYLGTYTVSAQDQFFDLSLAVRVVAPDGSESVLTLAPPVTLDGVPPAPVSGLVASDTPGDEGLSLEARWDPSPAVDLAEYWVYLSPEPIGSVAGLQPVVTTSRTQTSVPVPEAEREWFLAVVAVDRAGNPSGLGTQSTAGPVVAADNRPPQPVRGVQLLDRPWDLGGTLLARWQPVVVPDFSTYRLYLDVEPIATTAGRSPVVELPYSFWTVADLSGLDPAQEYFLAVTAVDRAGNESALGSESVAGPIAPRPELAESPAVNGLYLPTGTVRTGRVPIAWDLFQHGGVVRLRLDGGPARALEGGWALLEGLQPGDHRVELLDSGGTVRASAQIAVAPEALVPPQDISSPVPLESGLPWTVFKTGRFLWRGSGAGGVVFLLEALEGSFTAQLLRDGSMIGTAPVEAGQAATLWASDDDSELLLSGEGRLTLVGFRLPGLSFEREPNETTSGRFLLGESPEVRFGQAEGQDTYRWSLDETSDLLLEAVSGSGRTEILWRLIQEPDLLVAEWVGEGGALGRRRELRLRAGTYRLEASALASSSTFYGLRVSRGTPSGTREVEPNDRSGQETDLLLDRPAVGALDKPRDLDRYRLTVGRQGYLLVRVEPIVGNAELSAGIIALDGTPLAEARSAEPIDLQALLSGASVRLLLQGEGGEGSYRVAATLVPGLEAQGRSTLRAGESVTVRVTWSPGRQVEALWAGEDGTPLSGPAPLSETRSGQYEGSLQVAEGLDGERRRVLLRLRDGELSYRLLSPTGYRIDTVPPQIQEAAHNAQQAPLGLGATLTVQVRAEPGLSGTFDLLTAEGVAFRAALPLPEEEAGLYVGRYPVDESSFLENGRVQVLLRDTAENETRLTLPEPVTLDVTPPVVESVGHDGTALLTEGTRLLVRLTGERGATGSFFLLTEEGEIFRGPLPLFDDGRHADGEAGDGHYAGSYTVRPGDFLRSGRVQAELRDLAGNRTAVEAALPVRVDAAPARIEEVVHDATRPLRAGERLLVTVRGSLEATAFFRLIAPDGSVYRDNLPMSDDGTLDETPGDGVYAGFYEVAEGDQLYGGRVEVVLRKPTGTEARRSASVPIAVDAVSPAPIQGVQAEDLPGDEGGFLRLRWEPTTAPDFVRYEVVPQ
ncbi:MAG: hypothetical protein KatS3mg115_0143 [Candidatus Poribacteria bacterium]|nr:MAG: hypothetical protein KatS3mg115_0143 [Candidatus Poribacteria bacterium]